jgi:hypothetical protein
VKTAIARIIAVAAVLIAVAAVLLSGACDRGPRLSGTYIGTRPFSTPKGSDPVVTRQIATVKLKVMPDGTANLSDSGLPLGGRIEYGSDGATFVPLTVAGRDIQTENPDLLKSAQATLKPTSGGGWIYKGDLELKKIPDEKP